MNKKGKDEGGCGPPFPEDFAERLERLIEFAGLSREEFAQRLGIDYDRVAEWFEGAELTGGEVWHVARLAWSIPGGLEIIVPGGGRRGGVAVRSNAGPASSDSRTQTVSEWPSFPGGGDPAAMSNPCR